MKRGKKAVAPVLTLVRPDTFLRDVKQRVSFLVGEDNAIGLAYVVFYPGRDYSAGVVGVARADPTFARGALDVLRDKLGELIGHKKER